MSRREHSAPTARRQQKTGPKVRRRMTAVVVVLGLASMGLVT